jgi:hypothetical protein
MDTNLTLFVGGIIALLFLFDLRDLTHAWKWCIGAAALILYTIAVALLIAFVLRAAF